MDGHRRKRQKLGASASEQAPVKTKLLEKLERVEKIVKTVENNNVKATGWGVGISSNWLKMKAEVTTSSRRKGGAASSVSRHNHTAKVVQKGEEPEAVASPQPRGASTELTKVIAMDCEMVGVGENGTRSILARVCLVNAHGNVLYDKHVQPLERVTDYRTHVSGVRAKDLKKTAVEFFQVQKEVAALLKDRIVVGHALQNDMQALLLSHPRRLVRDTSKYSPLRKNGRPRALRHLTEEILGLQIQAGEHSPVDDARAALYIYLKYRKEWEQSLRPVKQANPQINLRST